ncbi:MAG: HAD family hydrolase [Candidatus Zixiibacteriota bacterium]|nr:MAG: HAD family hydrolase [candidate division Zixibacteria bacterium]
MRLTHLIFDLDGTLIDSSDGVVAAVNYSLTAVGAPPQPAELIKRHIGYPLSKMYPHFTDAPFEELYRHFQTKAAETIVSSTHALDGADEVLRRLKNEGYILAVATTKVRAHVDGVLERLHWHELFTATVAGDEVPKVKPAPDCFLRALELMSAEPANTLVIGDTENDILAAHAVPMTAAAVASPYGGREKVQAAGPDYWLDTLEDLPALLATLNIRSAS